MTNIKTLLYVGEDYNEYFPWGGYHVTISGRTDVPSEKLLSTVQQHLSVFPQFENEAGWILTQSKITGYVPDETTMIMTYLKCEVLDAFVASLAKDSLLTNLKCNLHISMHTKCQQEAETKVKEWIERRKVFRVFVVEWNGETNKTQWFRVPSP